MGYDVHITRKVEWSDDDGPEITLDEWLAVVAADPELRHDGFAETTTPDGEVLRVEASGLTVWTAHPDDRTVWFRWFEDHVSATFPDPPTLVKMAQLATTLDANVQGDEGERYNGATPPDGPPAGTDPPPSNKRRWFGRA